MRYRYYLFFQYDNVSTVSRESNHPNKCTLCDFEFKRNDFHSRRRIHAYNFDSAKIVTVFMQLPPGETFDCNSNKSVWLFKNNVYVCIRSARTKKRIVRTFKRLYSVLGNYETMEYE